LGPIDQIATESVHLGNRRFYARFPMVRAIRTIGTFGPPIAFSIAPLAR
jgi:hypothetical protein